MKIKQLIAELEKQYKYCGDVEVELALMQLGQQPQFFHITYPTEGGVFLLEVL